jgi:hypothetical protein
VHVPAGLYLSESASYTIRHDGQETIVARSLIAEAGWVELEVLEFAEGGDQWVQITDRTGEDYEYGGKQVVFDALRVTPVQE